MQSVVNVRNTQREPCKNLVTIAVMRILFSALALSAGLVALPAHCETTEAARSTAPAPAKAASGADSGNIWRLMVSPYTYHYSYDAAHRYVWMIGAERQRPDGMVLGGTYFSNSFGQPSAYVYGGQRLDNWGPYPELFAEWTAGLLYGYKGKYAHKVPLNHDGFSPGVVLSVGWQFTPVYSAQLNVLGNSALMFQVSADLP